MARKSTIRAPTTSSLPNTLRIPSNTASLVRTLGKLSRQSLLYLVFIWLSKKNVELYPPFLRRDLNKNNDGLNDQDQEEFLYPAAETVEDVRAAYEELRQRKGGKREVIDRVLEGDWRHGIALGQLAIADIQYLEDHPTGQKWTAFRLGLVDKKRAEQGEPDEVEEEDLLASFPRLHAATFLSNLQREISPLVKAHYHLARSRSLPLAYLRIFITDSPYQIPRHGAGTYLDSSRILYIAFPDSSPFIYMSTLASAGSSSGSSSSGGTTPLLNDPRTLRGIVRNALPKALSKQHERYKLEPTSLTAKSLKTMLTLRGPGRTNEANGVFSIFADAVVEGTPIDPRQPATVSPEDFRLTNDDKENTKSLSAISAEQEDLKRKDNNNQAGDDGRSNNRLISSPATKRRKLVVASRFGTSGTSASQAALNRLDIRLLDRLDDANDNNDDSINPDEHAEDADDDDGDNDNRDAMNSSEYTVSLSFTGNNVISGLRKLAELGVVDPKRMPSWMTGEEGVSSAVIRKGKRIGAGAGR